MDMTQYIYPELVFLIPFLNLIGWWVKHKTELENKFIPLILGCMAVMLSTFYIYTTMNQGIGESLAQGTLQGVFLASTAVYANQLTKTISKDE